MSDRPKAANGKHHVFWGTLRHCPSCGRCLCFGCHPEGPCVDDRAEPRPPRASDHVAAAAP